MTKEQKIMESKTKREKKIKRHCCLPLSAVEVNVMFVENQPGLLQLFISV